MNDALTEVRFWAQVIGDSERTIFCPPDYESRIKTWVDDRGMGGILTVLADRCVPEGQIIIADVNSMEAGWRESLQRTPVDWKPSTDRWRWRV